MLQINNLISDFTNKQIMQAVMSLHSGNVVVFPTETVYGLGADISHPQAIQKIFDIKGRPSSHPLIVHFANLSELEFWAENIPATAWILAQHFWPGPLTLILPKSSHIPLSVTGGQETVGLRIPRHPIALRLLEQLGSRKALAAPSANRFGFVSPTIVDHVKNAFNDKIEMILDGGPCEVGLESTIVSCIDKDVTILRPGGISVLSIENLLQQKVSVKPQNKIHTPGSLSSHYATVTPLEICQGNESLFSRSFDLLQQGIHTAVIIRSTHLIPMLNSDDKFHYILMPNDPVAFGKNLYATLRKLDDANFERILVEAPPDDLEWLAVADRLNRASHSFTSK